MNIGKQIRMAMTDRGVASANLARQMGVSRQTVYRWRMSDDLKWSTIMRFCDGVGITPVQLVNY